MKRTLANIQALRGVAATLVVVSHLGVVETKYAGDAILPGWTILGFSGVDLFFVISGFIMTHVTRGDFAAPRAAGAFLFSRLTRIYPLYWLISLVVLAVWLARPDMVFNSAPESPDLLKSFLLWPDDRAPMLTLGWTLIHELYFYLVFALILLLPERWLPLALIIWGAIVAILALSGAAQAGAELALIAHPLTYEFLLGALAGVVFHRVSLPRWTGAASLCGGLILFLAALAASANLWPGAFPEGWTRAALFGPSGALIVYGLCAAERGGARAPRQGEVYGDWSYALYLSHVLTLSALGRLWAPVRIDGPADNLAALVLMLAASALVAALLHRLAERPMLNVTRRWRRALYGARPGYQGAGAP